MTERGAGIGLRAQFSLSDPSTLGLCLAVLCWCVSAGISVAFCIIWCLGSEASRFLMQEWMSPSVAMATFMCSVALVLKLKTSVGPCTSTACALAGGTAVVFGVSSWLCHVYGTPFVPPDILANSVCHVEDLNIRPVAATVLVAMGTAIIGRALETEKRWPTVVFIVNAFVSTGYAFVWILYWISDAGSDASHMFLPASAVALTACNAGFVLTERDPRLVDTFLSQTQGSVSARRILLSSALSLFCFGVVRTLLQTHGMVDLQEGTALMVSAAIVVLALVLYGRTVLVNRIWLSEQKMMVPLQHGLLERRNLLIQLEHERLQLTAVLRAAVGFSIIATDVEGCITIFNEGASRMLGYTSEEMVGKQSFMSIHDCDEVNERARTLNVKPGFEVFRVIPDFGATDEREWSYMRKDGSRLPVWLSVTSLHGSAGQIVGYVAVARDLSSEKRTHREREGLLNIGQELLCQADIKGYLRIASPSFTRITGWCAEDIAGRPYLDFVHPEDHAKTMHFLEQLSAGITVRRFENRWRTRDGRHRLISWDVTPPDTEGLMFASGWDVTDERARQAELQRYLEFEKQLIGIVSHDLRTPIAAIDLAAQSIGKQSNLPEKAQKKAQRIVQYCARAARMIHDLLDFTQARLGGGLRVTPEEMDLRALIQQVIEEVHPTYTKHAIEFRLQQPLQIRGDFDRLTQVFTNLLTNSFKYGACDVPVTVAVKVDTQACDISIHNGGNPIPPELLPHLFSPMRRSARAKTDPDHSIGLGLYIASELVRAHGGNLGVESTSEDGTTFCVHLPVQRPATTNASQQTSPMI